LSRRQGQHLIGVVRGRTRPRLDRVITSAPVTTAVSASPYGPIHLAVSPTAVVGLELRTATDAFTAGLRRRGFEVERSRSSSAGQRLLDRAIEELEAYLAGARRDFDLPLDLRGRSDWDRRVLAGVRAIPYGRTSSYGGVALSIGARGAARAVGGAVGRNPIGLLIPCHRVIAGDGTIGGYGGAWSGDEAELRELKRELLAHEGVIVR
jgi:methylated-DNA-[protein]-cysteine S-methyltransferase